HNCNIEGFQIWILNGEGWTESTKTEKLLSFAIENVCRELFQCETFIYHSKVIAIVPIYDTKQHFDSKKIAIQKIEEMLRCHIRVTVGKQAPLQNLHESYLSSEQ